MIIPIGVSRNLTLSLKEKSFFPKCQNITIGNTYYERYLFSTKALARVKSAEIACTTCRAAFLTEIEWASVTRTNILWGPFASRKQYLPLCSKHNAESRLQQVTLNSSINE